VKSSQSWELFLLNNLIGCQSKTVKHSTVNALAMVQLATWQPDIFIEQGSGM
jgi:hypothetical protein